MTFDLATHKPKTMPFTRAKSSHLPLASKLWSNDDDPTCSSLSSSLYNSSGSQQQRKLFLAPPPTTFGKGKRNYSSSSSAVHVLLVALFVTVIVSDLLTTPVDSSPLPSSSAWSLPTLNYLFKDTKTRSQSTQYKRESENGDYQQHNHKSSLHHLQQSSTSPGTGGGGGGGGGGNSMENGINHIAGGDNANGKVSSTGRLISAHDIRLTDNWGWVRRGASDPQTTTEQRRKQNIRHSKSKHKQRHHYTSSPSATSGSSGGVGGGSGGISSSSRGRNKDKKEHLLCPFDEIRGPDGKCRKAPRFSLYRVG